MNQNTNTMKTAETKTREKLNKILDNTDMFPYTEGEATKEGVIDLLIENKDEFIKILNKVK